MNLLSLCRTGVDARALSAERLWYERMKGLGQTFPVWPDFSLQECEEQVAGLRSIWKEFLIPADRSQELSGPVG